MTNQTALSLARIQFKNNLDNLQRAGVKIRIASILRNDRTLDDDSVFIKAVSDELNGAPLP